ncbi:hypothetical protein FQN51_003679 [Onygenales sp. PD_10]|nr:hypothetical protein FQN51_003679 [Onygenales sp. PD_10]
MPASASDSRKAQKLDEDSFVAFGHAAAGHDGVLCNPSGSLIAKPCTPREVDFYQSGPQHPGFWQFMPRFIGTLSNPSPEEAEALSLPTTETGTPALAATATIPSSSDLTSSSGTDTPLTPELSKHSEVVTAVPAPIPTEEKQWVPSGGQKINTGISIVLENVTAGFKRPNVLDVKLGARLWDDDSIPAKRARLDDVSRETTSGSLGFRIAGMKVYVGEDDNNSLNEEKKEIIGTAQTKSADGGVKSKQIVVETTTDGYKRYDKWYGRSFNADNVTEGFKTFLASAKRGKIDRSKLVAGRLVEKFRAIQAALEAEESRMYSASILIVYEGDPEAFGEALVKEQEEKDQPADESDDEELDGSLQVVDIKVDGESVLNQATGENGAPIQIEIDPSTIANLGDLDDEDEDEDEFPHKALEVRLIDFAHARWTPGQGPDENALRGVRSLVGLMERLAGEG